MWQPVCEFLLFGPVTYEICITRTNLQIIVKFNDCAIVVRASDISRKKKQNFAGFSGVNSRKNRPISRDFRGKKVKIR